MKKQNIVIIVLAFVVILGALFAYISSNKTETAVTPNPILVPNTGATTPVVETGIQKIDEHLTINNELRDVNFCGKTYKVKRVLIDGVDVVQRVAELATKGQIIDKKKGNNVSESICSNINRNNIPETDNGIDSREIQIPDITNYNNEKGNKNYEIYIQGAGFQIDSFSHDLYRIAPMDGSPIILTNKL